MTLIAFFLILSLLVLVHEFGHFIAAKKNGVLVEEFGLGLPPRIFGYQIGETLYSINLLPFGGFVKVYGEEYYEENTKITKNLRHRAFISKKPWQKMIILTAGVVGNFILGWVLISYLFTQGIPALSNTVVVERVQKNSPAEEAGLKPKDIILAIKKGKKSYKINSPDDLIHLAKKFNNQTIALQVKRKKQELDIVLRPRKNPPKNQGPIGIVISSFVVKKYPWYKAPFFGLIEASRITIKIVNELTRSFFLLISFKKPKLDVTGPIGIAKFTGQAIRFGQNALLELIALLSLNLAVINILPFPALDGGRLAFVVYEWITRKKVNQQLEKRLNLIGIIILITIALLVSVKDIRQFYINK